MKNDLSTRDLYPTWEFGLLVIRIGIGFAFMWHGAPKLFGGPETWARLGEHGMGSLGIHFFPQFWGLMSGIAEFGGGVLIALGFGWRIALGFMMFTMIAAIAFHISSGKGSVNHALESLILFAGLFLIGPGKYTIQQLIRKS